MHYSETDTDRKLNIAEAAIKLGISKFTLRAWIRERRVPFFRCGRRIVFAQKDLDLFLERCRVKARAEV